MTDKKNPRWAGSASAYRPSSAPARSAADAKPTRPWHVDTADQVADQATNQASRDQSVPRAWARTLPAAVIEADRDQPRRTFDPEALRELADSILAHGVLQPLVVRRDAESGTYVVVAGERRLRAARMAGLAELPCMVLSGESLKDARLAQLAENMQREDLVPMEEARAVVRLAEVEGLSQEEIRGKLGKSAAYISRLFSVSRIPSMEYERFSTLKVSASVLYEYSQLPPDEDIRMRAAELIAQGATVKDLEGLRLSVASGRSRRGRPAEVQKRRGRPMRSVAQVSAIQRAVDALVARPVAEAAGLDSVQKTAIATETARLARWVSRCLANEPALAEALVRLEEALSDVASRVSGAQPGSPSDTADREDRTGKSAPLR